MKKLFSVLFLLLFASLTLNAQTFEETVGKLSSSAGKAYVAPVISAFGSNMNSGWVSKLPAAKKVGFTLDLKIVGIGSFFSDDVKTFSANDEFFFSSAQVDQLLSNSNITPASIGTSNYNSLKQQIQNTAFTVGFSGPTIVGKKTEYLKVKFPGKTITSGSVNYNVQAYDLTVKEVYGFLDELPVFPSGAIQLTAGTVAGTNVSVRFLPSVDIQDLGKFSFWGLGALHNPGAWFPNPLPLDLGVGFFYQKLAVGDVFESNATQFGVYAGKTFGGVVAFSPFIGLTLESSKTSVKYDYKSNQVVNGVQVPPVKISMDLEGENTTGVTVGFNLKLSFFNINADYKVAKTNTVAAGISLGF